MQLLTIVAMLFAAASVLFALQNNVPVTVTFLLWRFDSSLAMVLLIAMGLGGLIVALVSTPATVRRQWNINRQRKRIADLEQTCSEQKARLEELRPMPADVAAKPTDQPYVGLKRLIAGATGGDRREGGAAP